MRHPNGNSLVEVLIAGLVILAGMLPVGLAVGEGVRFATRGRYRAEAAVGAMSRLEQIRNTAGRSPADCHAIASGSAWVGLWRHEWEVSGDSLIRTVSVVVTRGNPIAPIAESAMVRIRCP